jgi:hypothetical protein
MPHNGHWCSAGHRATKTEFALKRENQKTVEALEKAWLLCTIIDLGSASSTAREKAKIEGVNATPTLIYKGQKLEGLQQIMGLLEMPTDI